MSTPRLLSRARVAVEVWIELPQGWDPACTLEQAHKQAASDASDAVRRMIDGNPSVTSLKVTSTHVSTTREPAP